MKIIRTPSPGVPESGTVPAQPSSSSSPADSWPVLVVDDDPDVLAITRLALKDCRFSGRPVCLYFAQSAKEALEIYQRVPEIALALVDVVMETDDAGLKLVQSIRNDFKNHTIRLIIRTGQPGHAPERMVIDTYDIDDYKDKTELTASKLYTTVRSALKSFRDLKMLQQSRHGLEMVLRAAPGMYLHPVDQPDKFFLEALGQIIRLCESTCTFLEPASTKHRNIIGFLAILNNRETLEIRARWKWDESDNAKLHLLRDELPKIKSTQAGLVILSEGQVMLPLLVHHNILGIIYLENITNISENERCLLEVYAVQCAGAMENLRLYEALAAANRNAMRMLAVAAEFKDTETGDHVKRLARQTVETALELGFSQETAQEMGRASVMHDIGKIGVPDAVLLKPGPLTKDEFEIIKTHPGIGASILAEDSNFKMALDVALSHHERWDGTGYPMGLKGEEIPLPARIVAVVDVFDALVSDRPYKKAWSVMEALEEIKRGAGTHFDPQVVEAFLRTHRNRREKRGQMEARAPSTRRKDDPQYSRSNR
ncbi:MAG: DUF3369 domain-containing protein [Magnetococcales bacterium]|nr:DUF3369 domain-containing protein [Magnetococcales bacterium]